MPSRYSEGMCRVCGQVGPLTFEHVPPRAAFNNYRTMKVRVLEAIRLGPDEQVKGPVQQRGAGGYTLCGKCNHMTGHWYGPRFVDFCYQAMDLVQKSNGRPSLVYPFRIYPLAVLKQIVTMFLSTTRLRQNTQLGRFVLDPEAKYLNPRFRYFIFYNLEGYMRSTGLVVASDFMTGQITPMSEISFPPLGYLMTIDCEPPDDRLVEITHFSRFNYDESRDIYMRLPVLPTCTPYPGDYRERKQILLGTTGIRS